MTTRTIRQLDREPGQRPRTEVAMEALQVGQSFLVPGAKRTSAALGIAKLITGKKFRTRALTTGVRIWRIE